MNKSLALVVAVSLSACATQAGYKRVVESWLGAPEHKLIASWGAPQRNYRSGGFSYLTYSNSRTVSVPGQAPSFQTTYIGNVAFTQPVGGSPGFVVEEQCETTFTVKDGIVHSYSFAGSGCKAIAEPSPTIATTSSSQAISGRTKATPTRSGSPYSSTASRDSQIINDQKIKIEAMTRELEQWELENSSKK